MYRLPDSLRSELARPMGPVVAGALRPHLGTGPLATVGDVVTGRALEEKLVPKLMVVDGKTHRSEVQGLPRVGPEVARVPVENPAARITDGLWQAVAAAYTGSRSTLIHVHGEEDLATLPAIVHAPTGANVVYGQPDEGAVIVTVDQTTRKRALDVLARMEVV